MKKIKARQARFEYGVKGGYSVEKTSYCLWEQPTGKEMG